MSFFDDSKNLGLALLVVAVLNIILAIAGIIGGVTGDEVSFGVILVGIGGLISAVIYFMFAQKVRQGNIKGKFDILASFVKVVGIVTIVGGVFSVASNIGAAIVGVILGLIILWCASQMTDNKASVADNIIWIVLAVVFVLNLLGSLMSILSFPIGTISGICGVVIYIFMLIYLFDPEVKKKMNM